MIMRICTDIFVDILKMHLYILLMICLLVFHSNLNLNFTNTVNYRILKIVIIKSNKYLFFYTIF